MMIFGKIRSMPRVKKESQPTHHENSHTGRALVFYIHLEGLSPMIWRRLLICENNSLGDLHYAIQIAFGWDDSHLNHFHIQGQDYCVYHEGGVAYSNANEVTLSDFSLRTKDRFLYEYDFHVPWRHIIRVEKMMPLDSNDVPICIGGEGLAPPEDCGGREGFRSLQDHYSQSYVTSRLIEIIDRFMKYQERPSQEESHHLQRWIYPRKINRGQINQRLKFYATGNPLWMCEGNHYGNSITIDNQI